MKREEAAAASNDGAGAGRNHVDLYAGLIHRQIVQLSVVAAAVVIGFLFTRAAAGASRQLRDRDAAHWYATGEHERASGHLDSAIDALRRATAIAPDRRDYQLALASALADGQQDNAVWQILIGLRDSTPEDPDINTQLARLEVRRDHDDQAVRYYQNALYGLWRADQAAERRLLSVELIHYLLARGQRSLALSELLALLGTLPDDVASHQEAGDLLLKAGDPRRSLDQFRRVLRLEPGNATALAGAGAAAFDVGDYVSADRFFRAQARSGDARSSEVASRQVLAALVLEHDPLRPRLSGGARLARLAFGLEASIARADRCLTLPQHDGLKPEPLTAHRDEARAFAATLTARTARDLDTVQAGVQLMAQLELGTPEDCAPLQPLDRALLLIARRQHEASPQ